MKFAIVTFIYSSAISYFGDLVDSLNNQTNKNFDIIFFNDGIENPIKYFLDLELNFSILDLKSGTPMELRFEGLALLKLQDYDYYIFQDCDDFLSDNRVEIISKYADTYDLITNDLSVFNQKNKILNDRIWKDRFIQNVFSFNDLINYNFVGLGNTSIRSRLLNFLPPKPSENLLAIDWYIFYFLMKVSETKGYFTSETTTFYRQHDLNTIGIENEKKLTQILVTREVFYKLINFQKSTDNKNVSLPNKIDNHFPFWWELKFQNDEKY